MAPQPALKPAALYRELSSMVNKPPLPSKVRRPPAPGRENDPRAHLARSYVHLPTLAQWQADTAEGRVSGRANDPVLRSTDDLVQALQTAVDGARLYLLGQLFFSTMYWMNHQKTDPLMDTINRKPVMSLNLFASNSLAAGLGCGLGQLAERLQSLYGVNLSQHGIDTDASVKPRYFDAAKREVYRTFVVYGKLHHFRSGANSFVLLDSGGSFTDGRPGFGFVLSMSNELFIGNFGQMRKTYHSTFMAGRPIQCAGTIQLTNGRVTHIKNDSGHYKPVDQALVKALQYLSLNGIDTSGITVESAVHQVGDADHSTTGAAFMAANGNWQAIRARAPHQPRL